MQRLANDRTLQLKMGNAARKRLLDGFTEAHVIAAILSSYRSISTAGPYRRTVLRPGQPLDHSLEHPATVKEMT
jgi:hypothetical protein